MKSEDGTGSRRLYFGDVGMSPPPMSFISKMVTPVTIFFFDYH